MKNLNVLQNIPTSALTDITQSENSSQSEISGNDFGATGQHTQAENYTPNFVFGEDARQPKDNLSAQQPTQNTSQGAKLGNVVGGKTATEIVDILFPSLCIWVVSSIGYNVPKGRLQMTAKEKEILTPAMQAYLDSINVNFNNPLYNLLFVFGSIYVSKTVDIISSGEIKSVTKSKVEGKKVVEIKPESEWTVEDFVNEITKRNKKGKVYSLSIFQEHEEIFKSMPFDEAYKKVSSLNKSKARGNK